MRRLGYLQRHGCIQQVTDIERGPFAKIDLVVKLRAGVDIDNKGGTALDHRDLGPASLQFLTNIMSTRPSSHHDNGLAFPRGSDRELTRMQNLTSEILKAGDLRNVRRAAHARRHHDMLRVKRANAPISPPNLRRP